MVHLRGWLMAWCSFRGGTLLSTPPRTDGLSTRRHSSASDFKRTDGLSSVCYANTSNVLVFGSRRIGECLRHLTPGAWRTSSSATTSTSCLCVSENAARFGVYELVRPTPYAPAHAHAPSLDRGFMYLRGEALPKFLSTHPVY